eukprot:CAMPEP_0172622222 /NCGR_PEP_ID=MMETSP1068-20121228/118935_1 /TAXON_ID=35684 /ORGANISM="Pseudopedinella elastica, Strain CCMP716" /LENGTH=75 /DNA_ID=CAMNT_0013430327 /DNA_START=55 /DNA_END=279 /DNA_ORIENTATION=-
MASAAPGDQNLSDADIDSLGIKALKGFIESAGLGHSDCFEKPELRQRAREALAKLEASPKAPATAAPPAKGGGGG